MGDNFSKILPDNDGDVTHARLYLGTIDFMVAENVLTELDIRAIVSVLPFPPEGIQTTLERNGIDYHNDYLLYPLEDMSESYISLFDGSGIDSAVTFVDKKLKEGKNVLVHCDAGLSRSPAVVICYLMKHGSKLIEQPTPTPAQGNTNAKPSKNHLRMSFRDALAFVRKKRDKITVHMFDGDLRRYERELSGNCSTLNARRPPRIGTVIRSSSRSPPPLVRMGSTTQFNQPPQTPATPATPTSPCMSTLRETYFNACSIDTAFRSKVDAAAATLSSPQQETLWSMLNITLQDSTSLTPIDRELLLQSGISHSEIMSFSTAFISTLQTMLGTQWTTESEQTWRSAFSTLGPSQK